ncbi:MAG: FAD-binding oxidoreductase [Crocinitomicaceae bacterium]|nr:FAD-binding oxidoreductase [Crocinitomicaceae bacterium]
MRKDFIIVGQGIAGSVLSFLLSQYKGLSVLVVDDGHRGSSSMVAPGMWTPVTFRKLSQSWMASEFLPVADHLYRSIEKVTGTSFYHPLPLVRIFHDTGSANAWDERSLHPDLSPYLTDEQDENIKNEFIQPFGHSIISGSGWMDLPVMLRAMRQWLAKNNSLLEETFDYNSLIIDEHSVKYKDNEASQIVFCTGVRNCENPLFNSLSIIPNKGEVLTVKLTGSKIKNMVNFGNFLIPVGNDLFRLGATYQLDASDDSPTKEAVDELIAELAKVYPGKIELIQHLAGMRPTSITRKPLIGKHPRFPRAVCFNGLGSKGVMIAPWTARHLCDHLLESRKIQRDMQLERYLK